MTTARWTKSDDPYDHRPDLADVITLRRTDSRTIGRPIDQMISDLTARQIAGREVNTISARPAAAWVIGEIAAGRRVIGHQDVIDRFALSRSTVGRMFKQLRAAGILWIRWFGKKGIGNSIWALAPRAVEYLVVRVRRRREKLKSWKEERKKVKSRKKSQVNVSKIRTGFAPGSKEGLLSTQPPPLVRPDGPACPNNEYRAVADCPYCRAFPGQCAKDAQLRADLVTLASPQVKQGNEARPPTDGLTAAQRAAAAVGWTPPPAKRGRRYNYDAAFRGSRF